MKNTAVGAITRSYTYSCTDISEFRCHLLDVARQLGWAEDSEHHLADEHLIVLTTIAGGHTLLLVDASESGVLHITAQKSGIYRYDWNGNLRQIHTLKARLAELRGYNILPINHKNNSTEPVVD